MLFVRTKQIYIIFFSLAGYSCRLISQSMSLILVNEDSLDVSN